MRENLGDPNRKKLDRGSIEVSNFCASEDSQKGPGIDGLALVDGFAPAP
jgi:hypothetical protein